MALNARTVWRRSGTGPGVNEPGGGDGWRNPWSEARAWPRRV